MAVRIIKKSWYVDFRFKRKRYRRKSPENSKAGAKAYESLLISKLLKGESIDIDDQVKKVLKFREYAKEWLKIYVHNNNKPSEQYKKKLILKNHLNPFLGNIPIDKISEHKIEKYKSIKLKKLKKKTINNQLAVLSKCLRCAYKELGLEMIKLPEIKLFRPDPVERREITDEEIRLLLLNGNGVWQEMILVALQTGLRIGEMLALEWDYVNFDNQTIVVKRSMYRGKIGSTKNHETRTVSMTDDIAYVLSKRKNKTGFVFTDDTGKLLNHDRALRNIHRIRKLAGLKEVVTWHDLRHYFCSNLMVKGIPRQLVSEMMGHSSEKMTKRYTHLPQNAFESVINKLKLPYFNEVFGHQMGTEENES